jgi:hypothetical protein
VNLKRKYEEASDYMDCIATTTVKQNRLIEMIGPTGPKESQKMLVLMSSVGLLMADGAWFISKSGSGREHTDHPQDLNVLTSTTNMDDATRKLSQRCSKVSATPNAAMRLDHLMTGDKYSNKQMEHIFEQAKCAVRGEETIHPDKTTASNLLEILDDMPNRSYLALVHDPKSELLRVKKSRVCNKKLRKETKKGAQHLTLLTKASIFLTSGHPATHWLVAAPH